MSKRTIVGAAVALVLGIAGWAQAEGVQDRDLVAGLHRQASAEFKSAWQQYISADRPFAFALAIDGSSAGSIFCKTASCTDRGNHEARAIRSCERGATPGVSCAIYARGRGVEWQGPFPWLVDRDILSDYWISRSNAGQ